MKIAELRQKTPQDLQKQLVELRNAQLRMRVQRATQQQLSQTHLLREAKRDVARIKTVLREMQGKNV